MDGEVSLYEQACPVCLERWPKLVDWLHEAEERDDMIGDEDLIAWPVEDLNEGREVPDELYRANDLWHVGEVVAVAKEGQTYQVGDICPLARES